MEQKLILVYESSYDSTLESWMNDGWRISQITAPGTASLTPFCWILLERTK